MPGGAGKRFLFCHEASTEELCYGVVGSSKFCIKPLVPGSKSCGVVSHGGRKFSPLTHTFYIKESDSKAYCQPGFYAELDSPSCLNKLLGQAFSLDEWSGVFAAISSNKPPAWLTEDSLVMRDELTSLRKDDLALDTINRDSVVDGRAPHIMVHSPSQAQARTGIFFQTPSLSFGDDSVETSISESSSEGKGTSDDENSMKKIHRKLRVFHDRFKSIKSKWSQTFHEVEAGYLMVIKDVSRLHEATQNVRSEVGSPSSVGSYTPRSLWDGLTHVAGEHSTNFFQLRQSLTNIQSRVDHLTTDTKHQKQMIQNIADTYDDSLDDRLCGVEQTITHYERRFGKILQFMKNFQSPSVTPPSSTTPISSIAFVNLQCQVADIQVTLNTFHDSSWQSQPPSQHSTPPSAMVLEEQIRDMAPTRVLPAPRLESDLASLAQLLRSPSPPTRLLRPSSHRVVIYGFVDASGAGFGSTFLLPNSHLFFCHEIWGRDADHMSSNFRELENLVDAIEDGIRVGELSNTELFVFTDNSTAEGAYYKGNSSSKLLFNLVLRLRLLEMSGSLHLHVTHVAGSRMVQQGTDGLSRGDYIEGVMAGASMLSYIPLHLSAIDRHPLLLSWLQSWLPSSGICPLAPEQWYERGHGIFGGSYNTDGMWYPTETSASWLLWTPPPAAAAFALDELGLSRHKRTHLNHIFVCPRLMTQYW